MVEKDYNGKDESQNYFNPVTWKVKGTHKESPKRLHLERGCCILVRYEGMCWKPEVHVRYVGRQDSSSLTDLTVHRTHHHVNTLVQPSHNLLTYQP